MRRLTAIGACKAGKRAAIPAVDMAVEDEASRAAAAEVEVVGVAVAVADVVDECASMKGDETQ